MDFVDHLDVEAVADDITGFVQDVIPLIELAGDALETVAENLGLIIPLVGAFIGFDLTTKALGSAVGIMGIFKNVKSLAPVIAANYEKHAPRVSQVIAASTLRFGRC